MLSNVFVSRNSVRRVKLLDSGFKAGQHAKVHTMSYGAAAASTNESFGHDGQGRAAPRPMMAVAARTGPGELAVEVAGRGHPVLLVHGWGVDRRMWAHQVAAFRRYFTTITYDRRGSGQSTAPADHALELEDIEAILDELKLKATGIVGMSQGGRIAMRYAITRPARVTGLVLQGAPLDDTPGPLAADASVLPMARLADLLRRGDRAALARELSQHPLMSAGSRRTQAQAEIDAMLKDYRGEDLMRAASTPAEMDPLRAADLAAIQAPTLVITGSNELLWLRRIADRIARNIHGARRRVIRGGGHFVNMTHVGDYNRCVVEFLVNTTRPWSERALGSV
jgi:pimeloyl-ACP methyl ester carboxylesterase